MALCHEVVYVSMLHPWTGLSRTIFRFLKRHRLSALESRQAAGLGTVVAADPGDVVTIADVQPPQLASIGAALGGPVSDERKVGPWPDPLVRNPLRSIRHQQDDELARRLVVHAVIVGPLRRWPLDLVGREGFAIEN